MSRFRLMSSALTAAATLLVAAPLFAAPTDWRAYPNGDRAVAIDVSPDWILIDVDQPSVPGIENVLGKVLPQATLARVRPFIGDRVGLEIAGADSEGLQRFGDALVEHELAARYWPAWSRATGTGFFDDLVVFRVIDGSALKALPEFGVDLIGPSALPGVYKAKATDNDAIRAAWALSGHPGVAWAEPDLIRDADTLAVTDDPQVGDQWHLGDGSTPGSINAYTAWDTTKGDRDIIVAVFDNGFDMDHPDLLPNLVGGFDAVGNDDDASAECSQSPDGVGPSGQCPQDRPYRQSHGTAVAGVAAARGDNRLQGTGVCPFCSLYVVRLLGEGSFRSLSNAEAFQRTVNDGAAVINNSWGPSITRFFPLGVAEREVFARATSEARDGKGVVIVFAAGNDGFTPANANPYASYPGVVTVAASTQVDDFACYSNYGEVIAVAAPSQGCFRGENGLATADYVGPEGYTAGDFGGSFGGTSAASPVVAGLAGLILSANPNLTAQQVRLVLQASAEKIRADKHDWPSVLGGFDLAEYFDYDENGFSLGFGYGRVDAAAAIALAVNPPPHMGACDENCARCIGDRCIVDCESDEACVGATRCLEQEDGAMGCSLPVPAPTDPGQPCTADCDTCVSTFDTDFDEARICTSHCETDEDCPFGFDCRVLDPAAPRACVPGNQECGEPYADVRCQSQVAVEGNGNTYCACDCYSDAPGSCPVGFVCSPVRCRRGRGAIICEPVENQFDANYNPQCVPDPNAVVEVPCESHDDCNGGLFCIDGTCQADRLEGGCDICVSCTADADCNAGEECVDTPRGTKCVLACEFNGPEDQCPADTVCTNLPGPADDYCVNPDFRTKGYCPRAYRCADEGRCFGDDDCDEGITCGEDRWCEDPEPPPEPEPPAEPEPQPEPEPEPPADMGVEVIEAPARQSDDCSIAAPSGGGSTPWALAFGLGALAFVRRRRR